MNTKHTQMQIQYEKQNEGKRKTNEIGKQYTC